MKKVSLMLLPLLLWGCDKTQPQEILVRFYHDPRIDGELADKIEIVKLRIDGDKIFLVVKNQDILLTEEKPAVTDKARYNINLSGVLPETNEKIYVNIKYDSKYKAITNVMFNTTHHMFSMGTELLVPMELGMYPMPDSTTICIDEISEKVSWQDGRAYVEQLEEFYTSRTLTGFMSSRSLNHQISAADAMAISENWDYNNLKMYENGGDKDVVEEWEQDACDVLERLNAYITEHGYDKPVVKYLNEMGCVNPDVVNLLCMLPGNDYEYFTMNICDNGAHTLSNRYIGDIPYELHERITDSGMVEYYTSYTGISMGKILYQPNTGEYRYQRNDNVIVACEKTEPLLSHQLCAMDIRAKTGLTSDGKIDIIMERSYAKDGDGIKPMVQSITLTQEQALAVTKNWDYNNLKLYQFGNEPHERDACDVWHRLFEVEWQLSKDADNIW